jgi:hypothetical protein
MWVCRIVKVQVEGPVGLNILVILDPNLGLFDCAFRSVFPRHSPSAIKWISA